MGALSVTLQSPISTTQPDTSTVPRLYLYQGDITLILETGVVINSPSATYNPRILYRDPQGNAGYWVATVSGTTLYADLTNFDLDVEGEWVFQAYFEDYSSPNNRSSYGGVALLNIERAAYVVSPLLP